MRVREGLALLVAHRGLELVEPYTRIDSKALAVQVLETGNEVSDALQLEYVRRMTYATGRPTGPKTVHSCLTPIVGVRR